MKLTFDIQTTKTIRNSKKKKLLKIPMDTHLDKIVNDLWYDIIRYIDYYPYLITDDPLKCLGYRIINSNEFNKDMFFNYYLDHNGINAYGRIKCGILLIGDHCAKIGKLAIQCDLCISNDTIKFYTNSSFIDNRIKD